MKNIQGQLKHIVYHLAPKPLKTTRTKLPALIMGVMACMIIAWLFVSGLDISLAPDREALIAAIWHHVGLGAILTPLLLSLVWWRLLKVRAAFGQPFWMRLIGLISVLVCLYLVVSGPLVVWTHGSQLKVFDWFVIANPLGKMPFFHDFLESSHVIFARIFPGIVLLDILVMGFYGKDR